MKFTDKIKIAFKWLTSKIEENSICSVYANFSGSNTIALYKLLKNELNIKLSPYKFSEEVIRSKIVLTTEGPFPYKRKRQIYIEMWHGFPLKAIFKMEKNIKYETIKENIKRWKKVDFIFSYSQLYNSLLSAMLEINFDKFVITGMPRNDLLLITNGKKNLEKLIKRNLQNTKIILYLPTFRKGRLNKINGKERKKLIDFEEFNINKFDEFLKDINALFIAKFHPVEEKNLKGIIKENRTENIVIIENEFLKQNFVDFYEILNSADILITDYSSVYFDFLLLDRPIIFVPFDIEEYRKNRGFALEPYEFWTPGPKVFNQKELQDSIEENLKYPEKFRKEREVILNLTHTFKDANSHLRVLNLLKNLL